MVPPRPVRGLRAPVRTNGIGNLGLFTTSRAVHDRVVEISPLMRRKAVPCPTTRPALVRAQTVQTPAGPARAVFSDVTDFLSSRCGLRPRPKYFFCIIWQAFRGPGRRSGHRGFLRSPLVVQPSSEAWVGGRAGAGTEGEVRSGPGRRRRAHRPLPGRAPTPTGSQTASRTSSAAGPGSSAGTWEGGASKASRWTPGSSGVGPGPPYRWCPDRGCGCTGSAGILWGPSAPGRSRWCRAGGARSPVPSGAV